MNIDLETLKEFFTFFFTLLQQVKLDKEYDIRGVAIQGRYRAKYSGWYVITFQIFYRKTVGDRNFLINLMVS